MDDFRTGLMSFRPLNSGHLWGVISASARWVIEPEYDWKTAKIMADCLNDEPDLDPVELTRLVRKQR